MLGGGPWPPDVIADILERFLERAREAVRHDGGKPVMEPTPVGEMGSFPLFADPDENVIGPFKEASSS